MRAIDGLNFSFDFSKFIKVADLIYFEGPLLSHYISEKGENYLFYWVDADAHANRWIIIRTDIFTIQKYLDKKIPLSNIITSPNDGFVYIVDIDENIQYAFETFLQRYIDDKCKKIRELNAIYNQGNEK